MKHIRKIAWYILVLAVSGSATSAQQEKAALRNLYEDSRAILQTWRGEKNEQEYLLSGGKSGLSAGLTFNGDTPNQARIGITSGRSLSVQAAGDRSVISLFEATGSDMSVLYDLDANGTWDARVSRSGKCEIFWEMAWHQVSDMNGLEAGIPHASIDGVEYEFSAGGWRPAAKKG